MCHNSQEHFKTLKTKQKKNINNNNNNKTVVNTRSVS